jgi:lauroyl/myristoyl acyltransferase
VRQVNPEVLGSSPRRPISTQAPPSAELAAALREHEARSIGEQRAEEVTPAQRLYSSPRLHRLIPDRLALAVASVVGTAQWAFSKRLRTEAVQYMDLLLEGTPRSREARALARRHLIESAARGIVFWRARMPQVARVDGLFTLERASRQGAGAILLSAHLGASSLAQSQAVSHRGFRLHVLGGEEWLFPDRFVGYEGHRAVGLRRSVERAGGLWIRPKSAYGLCEALLQRGELCFIPFDVPGGHATTFLNKPAWVRSGVARLSMATGAPIIPVATGREGHRLFVRLGSPIDPAQHAGLGELVDHLAQVVGAEILRRPAERERTPFLGSVWTHPESRA